MGAGEPEPRMPSAQLRLRPPMQFRCVVGDDVGNEHRCLSGILHPLQQVTDGLFDRFVILVCLGSRQSKP